MTEITPQVWGIATDFISTYGLATFLVIFLLTSFGKKLDRLTRRIDKMTVILMMLSKIDRSSLDDGDN